MNAGIDRRWVGQSVELVGRRYRIVSVNKAPTGNVQVIFAPETTEVDEWPQAYTLAYETLDKGGDVTEYHFGEFVTVPYVPPARPPEPTPEELAARALHVGRWQPAFSPDNDRGWLRCSCLGPIWTYWMTKEQAQKAHREHVEETRTSQ